MAKIRIRQTSPDSVEVTRPFNTVHGWRKVTQSVIVSKQNPAEWRAGIRSLLTLVDDEARNARTRADVQELER